MPKVIMKQIDLCTWQIITEKGLILKDDIKLGLFNQAEDYVRKYISSFNDWTYEMKPLEEK